MKTRKNLFVAALLVASAAMTGCSGELAQTDTPVVEQGGQVVYNVSIPATKDAGVVTRALATSGTDDASLGATWAEGDVVYAYYVDGETETYVGKLTPGTTGTASTTLTGTLTKTEGFAANDNLKLYYLKPKAAGDDIEYTGTTYFGDYSGQVGTVAAIGSGCDYATATIKVLLAGDAADFTGGDNILSTEAATFSHNQAVTRFAFTFKDSPVDVSALTITSDNLSGSPLSVSPSAAASNIFVAMHNTASTSQTYSFEATVGGVVYTAQKSVALEDGKYYKTTVPLIKAASNLTVTIPSQSYTGSQLTPVVTVMDGTTQLTENTDYTLTLPDGRTDVGNYTVTVNGTGSYSSTTTQTFTITKATTNTVAFSNTSTIVLTLGGTATTTRTATATWGTPTYSSSVPGVATVDASTGVITAVAPGTTVISASVADHTNYNACSTQTNITVYVKQAGIGGEIEQPGNAQNW